MRSTGADCTECKFRKGNAYNNKEYMNFQNRNIEIGT